MVTIIRVRDYDQALKKGLHNPNTIYVRDVAHIANLIPLPGKTYLINKRISITTMAKYGFIYNG
jgi:hypothetical protein